MHDEQGPDGARQVGSNWGRWGAEDERGALNLVTPERVRAALRIPQTGRSYDLGAEISRSGVPMVTGRSLPSQPIHLFSVDGGDYAAGGRLSNGAGSAEDYLFIGMHGSATHIDSLGHMWTGTELYNGYPSDTVRSQGMRRLGIENVGHIVTRGVLLDLAAQRGSAYLPAGHEVGVQELEACAAAQEVEIRAGDAVLLRTGWGARYAEDPAEYGRTWPGPGMEAARWLASRDVVVVGADNPAVEVQPGPEGATMPVHQLLLRDQGIYLIELMSLDELARDGVFEFLFMAAPLRVRGATGSPLNPVAIA
jgi:kynurenine formamidase